MFSHGIGIIFGKEVIRFSNEFDGNVGNFVSDSLRLTVSIVDVLDRLLGISIMGHPMAKGIIDSVVFRKDIMQLFKRLED